MNSYKSLIQYFRLTFSCHGNKSKRGLKFHAWWRTTQQTILKNFCQNTCNKTVIKPNFNFSHYKSMETLSCHSNQSAYSIAIKTRSGVYETLCPQHKLVPKDTLETKLLYYTNCQRWEREIIQPNIYRILLKVKYLHLGYNLYAKYHVQSSRGSPDILLTRSLMVKCLSLKRYIIQSNIHRIL